MTAGTLVFSHANGFPAGCYRLLFEAWRAAGWEVHAVDRFGHDPRYPVASGWRRLRDELIDFIDTQVRPTQPLTLVGHSLGGLLSLLVACRRPELAHQLVLIDAPVIGGWRAPLIGLAKSTGLIGRFSHGHVARARRHEWPDRAAVLQHFAAKRAFARWDERVLRDYADCGFEDVGGATRLRFHREVETQIYNTLPHHLPALLRRHPPRCPVHLIGGTQSTELRQAGLGPSKALVGERLHWVAGSHLFPFERPEETAAAVLRLLPAAGSIHAGFTPGLDD